MATSNVDILQRELKAFRSQLFEIDLDEESSRLELAEILNKYQSSDNFESFAEEYMIAGLEIEIVGLTIHLSISSVC